MVALAVVGRRDDQTLGAAEAVVLGVVEGVTEYLPVSSTGHLLVSQEVLGIGEEDRAAADAYAVVIQLGAILAVLVLYRDRIRSMLGGMAGRDPTGRRLALALVAGFVPAAVIGLALEEVIKDHLFGVVPVAAAWVVGGLAILAFTFRGVRAGRALEQITIRDGLLIGLAQALALWPGVSRSLVTILGGLAVGLATVAAVEYSFLLGLATLGAATIYEGVQSGSEIVDRFGIVTPVLGLVVALVSAVVAVRWMVTYLQTRSLAVFGWYRVAIGALTFALVALGML